MQIEKASAKIGEGSAEDDKKDIETENKYWSGVVKREERWTHAVPSPYCKFPEPEYVKKLLQVSQ